MSEIIMPGNSSTKETPITSIGYENLEEEIEFLINVVENSPEFDKLNDKTQMIFAKSGSKEVRNRNSHTRDVARISQKIAEKSQENIHPRLAYFIGLCHDLGHTAFGHDGESRLDKALSHYGINGKEYANMYYEDHEITIDERVESETPSYSFEHHAHSTRVLYKILKDKNIQLVGKLQGDIMNGILCHSQKRTRTEEVRDPLWAIARYADKVYAYTDMKDILNIGVEFKPDILDELNKEDKYIKVGNELRPFTEEDKKRLGEILEDLNQEGGLERYMDRYVDGANLLKEGGGYSYKGSPEMENDLRILKKVAEYLREKRVMGKQDLIAQAMIDEVFEYLMDDPSVSDLDVKNRAYRASIIVANATDTEIRELCREISKDEEWEKRQEEKAKSHHNNPIDYNKRSEEYPIRLTKRERDEYIKEPDKILQVR